MLRGLCQGRRSAPFGGGALPVLGGGGRKVGGGVSFSGPSGLAKGPYHTEQDKAQRNRLESRFPLEGSLACTCCVEGGTLPIGRSGGVSPLHPAPCCLSGGSRHTMKGMPPFARIACDAGAELWAHSRHGVQVGAKNMNTSLCYPMLHNSASGPEIWFPGRILAGFWSAKLQNRPSGRLSAGRFGGFPD